MFYFKMFSKSKVTPPENVVFKEQFKIFYFPEVTSCSYDIWDYLNHSINFENWDVMTSIKAPCKIESSCISLDQPTTTNQKPWRFCGLSYQNMICHDQN